jgi:hypothetical protein
MKPEIKNQKKKWTKLTKAFCFGQLVLAALGASAQAGEFSLLDFRVEGVGAINETGNSFSGVVSYLPAYRLMEKLDLKGNFGASAYRAVGNELMGVFNAGALVSYRVIPSVALEAGGGIQTWLSYGSSPMGNANVAWVPETPVLGRINKVVVGYSRLFQALPTDEVRVGIELNFGTLLGGSEPAQKDPSMAAK